jgi:hypothetical protein
MPGLKMLDQPYIQGRTSKQYLNLSFPNAGHILAGTLSLTRADRRGAETRSIKMRRYISAVWEWARDS